jgi:Ca2+-binding EF-hand superfamily protein
MLVLTEEQILRCQQVWQELVGLEQMRIDVFKLKDCLENVEVDFEHINVFYKLLSELNIDQSHEITFDVFLHIYQHHMMKRNNQFNEEDTLEAFVAVGGNGDKSGQVVADSLIKIIKDFQMTINIEQLIKEVDTDNSGLIEYGEFESMLSQEQQNTKDTTFKKLFFS